MFDVAKRRRRFAHGVVCSETPRACGHNALVRARDDVLERGAGDHRLVDLFVEFRHLPARRVAPAVGRFRRREERLDLREREADVA